MLPVMKHLLFALNVKLPAIAPEWVELIPAGPMVKGRDGREWKFGSYEIFHVINRYEFDGLDLVIDREHATEIKGAEGEEAPAAGWIKEMEDRNGALWGRVEWTDRAKAQIESREYRYLSPVFSYTKTDRAIRVLESAGLTNKPNLRLTALNRRATNMEEDTMKKALCRLLGLLETASDQEIQDAVSKLKGDLDTASNRVMTKELLSVLGLEENAGMDQVIAQAKTLTGDDKALNSIQGVGATLDLTKYVLRSDYDMAINRAETAETGLKQRDDADLDGKIEIAVNTAIKDGKIAPANKDFYVSMCRKDDGLEEFQKFAESAPKVIDNPKLPDEPKTGKNSLSDSERAVCHNLGLSEEDFTKSLKEDS
jgi:phage I-like protein